MSDFSGKVVIVTGSSSGIGQAAALLFAKRGASVVLHGQSKERLEETENLLRAAHVDAARVLTVRGSVENEAVVREIVDATIAKFGKIDVLVNNVGILKMPGADPNSMENFDYVFNVNLKSIVRITQLAVPHLEKTKGNIVNISSIGSKQVFPENMFYTMTKAALDHFTRNSAVLYASKGIRVNVVAPGPITTNFGPRFSAEIPLEVLKARHDAMANNAVPLKRIGTSEECASVIAFLAGDGAAYVTGVVWDVDGGFVASNGFAAITSSSAAAADKKSN